MDEFGKVTLNLEKLIQEKGISKTQLSYKAEISHTQINRFCKNDVARIDLNTIARLCHILKCNVADLLIYEPAENPGVQTENQRVKGNVEYRTSECAEDMPRKPLDTAETAVKQWSQGD